MERGIIILDIFKQFLRIKLASYSKNSGPAMCSSGLKGQPVGPSEKRAA